MKRAAGAPSMAQWSKVSESPMWGMNSVSSPFMAGFG